MKDTTVPEVHHHVEMDKDGKQETCGKGSQCRDRRGKLTNPDGSSFYGEWKEDQMHGFIRKTNKNNVSREGEWDKGVRKKWTTDVLSSIDEIGFKKSVRSSQNMGIEI